MSHTLIDERRCCNFFTSPTPSFLSLSHTHSLKNPIKSPTAFVSRSAFLEVLKKPETSEKMLLLLRTWSVINRILEGWCREPLVRGLKRHNREWDLARCPRVAYLHASLKHIYIALFNITEIYHHYRYSNNEQGKTSLLNLILDSLFWLLGQKIFFFRDYKSFLEERY